MEALFDCLGKVQKQTVNAIVLTSIFDVYNESLKHYESVEIDLEQIKCNYSREISFYYPVFRKSLLLFRLHKYRLQKKTACIKEALVSFRNSSYEEIETQLNVMLLLGSDSLDEEFEMRKDEEDFSKLLSNENKITIGSEAMLDYVIATKNFYPECSMKAFAMYSNLPCELKFSLDQIIDISCNEIGHSLIPLAMCIERITRTDIDYESFKMCLNYLRDISRPWSPDTLRLKASLILGNVCHNIPKTLEREDLGASADGLLLIFSLLQDDDLHVRKSTSEVVQKCIGCKSSPGEF